MQQNGYGTFFVRLNENNEVEFSNRHIYLNMHHKYYIKGKLPWEYSDSALLTVCHKCHSEIHEKEIIRVYDNENLNNFEVKKNCIKCNGTGYLEEYRYYLNGICFMCGGLGY